MKPTEDDSKRSASKETDLEGQSGYEQLSRASSVPATAYMGQRSMMVSQIAYAEQVRPEIKPIGLSTMAVG